jgi:hypothetical protein
LIVTAGVSVPVGASSLLVGEPPEEAGDDHVLRRAQMFPHRPNGEFDGALPEGAAVAQLEDLRAGGAAYLIVPGAAFGWLDERHGLSWHLQGHYGLLADDESCRVFDLRCARLAAVLDAVLPPQEPVLTLVREGAVVPLAPRPAWPVRSVGDIDPADARFLVVPATPPWGPADTDVLTELEQRYTKVLTRPGVCEIFDLSHG